MYFSFEESVWKLKHFFQQKQLNFTPASLDSSKRSEIFSEMDIAPFTNNVQNNEYLKENFLGSEREYKQNKPNVVI